MATVTAKALEQMMQAHVRAETGMSLEQATPRDYWTALSKSIVEIISENWMATRHKYNQGRIKSHNTRNLYGYIIQP